MKVGKTLYVTSRRDWRDWLAKNHQRKPEIWLIYYKKNSGRPRIDYNHAVEEALCYGWIDSTVKSIDDEKFVQRFTPRRKGSSLSQMNRERIWRLAEEGRMTEAGFAAIAHAFDPRRDKPRKPDLPADVEKALRSNEKAWKNWQGFPDSYKRMRIAYIKGQQRHSARMGRAAIRNLVRMTSANKRFGLMKE